MLCLLCFVVVLVLGIFVVVRWLVVSGWLWCGCCGCIGRGSSLVGGCVVPVGYSRGSRGVARSVVVLVRGRVVVVVVLYCARCVVVVFVVVVVVCIVGVYRGRV